MYISVLSGKKTLATVHNKSLFEPTSNNATSKIMRKYGLTASPEDSSESIDRIQTKTDRLPVRDIRPRSSQSTNHRVLASMFPTSKLLQRD